MYAVEQENRRVIRYVGLDVRARVDYIIDRMQADYSHLDVTIHAKNFYDLPKGFAKSRLGIWV